jgi:hypothetical protein
MATQTREDRELTDCAKQIASHIVSAGKLLNTISQPNSKYKNAASYQKRKMWALQVKQKLNDAWAALGNEFV